MNAIILAAGLGSRLASLTGDRPKCLLTLHGRTILEWQFTLLEGCGVEDITVVVGYRAESIRAVAGTRVRYAFYPDFARTNNLHTLQHCGEALRATWSSYLPTCSSSAAPLRGAWPATGMPRCSSTRRSGCPTRCE